MPARTELAGIHQVDQVFPLVAEGIETACRNTGGDTSAAELWRECRSGRAFLTVIIDGNEVVGADILRFEDWTTGKKLRCLALWCKQKDWLPEHLDFVTRMAKAGGASSLVAEGRKGFERVFRNAKVLRELFEVELT